MANNNKKYWWLKLKADFFTNKRIKKLRRVAGGDTYVLIYLKMQLLSLKNDGELYFEGVEDNMIDEIALEIDEDVENVAVTVMYLIKNELIEEVDKETYSLTETKECIGSETASTVRSRKHRKLISETKALQCNTDATKCNTEIEKELDTEKELDIEITTTIKEIVDYLNEKVGTSYRASSERTKKLIKARLNEKYTVDDFKSVIDIKCRDWKNSTEWSKFLRPETLFSNKFESYLQQAPKRVEDTEDNSEALAYFMAKGDGKEVDIENIDF